MNSFSLRLIALCSASTVCAPAVLAQPAATPAPEVIAQTSAAVNSAPAIQLRLQYHTMAVGIDGVQRDTRYGNVMVRRPGRVWVERDIPTVLRDSVSHSHEHSRGPHAGHAHDEAQGAPLQVHRNADGVERVEVVLAKTGRVIEVDRAHHGNVGYGGSWDTVYWLVPPATLKKMEAVGAAKNGVQRYSAKAGEHTTVVDWDVSGQYPRRVERKDVHGTFKYVMTASALPAPSTFPWKASDSYARGDYSDLLD